MTAKSEKLTAPIITLVSHLSIGALVRNVVRNFMNLSDSLVNRLNLDVELIMCAKNSPLLTLI